ncbi:uncharacterized protein LOC106717473 [Papilio machaon]|uniref:uncharacterized protein LOC106717473 n=1 Tax=Papilio machaon TaxID=76193 RepID=UPI001E666120|nr:uncharacterized protein LOC106717473 [Papilio machaon]
MYWGTNWATHGIYSNTDAIAEYREIVGHLLKIWTVVICCEDSDTEEVGDILGVSGVEMVEDKALDGLQVKTKEFQNLITIMLECEKLVKPLMKEFINHHDGRGITVHPDYRGLGIASEFVKTRRQMINEQNVPMSCAWMTSYGSQKAAEKDNWETLFEITPDELGEKCGVVFKDPPKTFKLMLVRKSSEQL